LHGFTSGDWKVRLYERLQLRTLRRSSAVVAVSRGVRDRGIGHGIPRSKVHLIPNGYAASVHLDCHAARQALGIPDDGSKQFVWIGRMSAEKGADVLASAMAHLRDTNIGITILGDGPDRPAIEQRVQQDNLNLRVLGRVENAAQYMAAFDGCVLSSRLEGTPMVLLEAMAAKLPIVATRVGGVPDVITHHEALLVPSEAPSELANAIRQVALHPEEARARADRAYERWEAHYALTLWIDRHEALYRAIQPSSH
jgi:glycosyltransferase involved in cell wall biosynthesis